jgi:hypothetical protein
MVNTKLPAAPVCPSLSRRRERDAARELRERRFREAIEAYSQGRITLTEARIKAGLASRRERLAYRFPRLFGSLCPLSSTDRLMPAYYAGTEPGRAGLQSEDIQILSGGRMRLLPQDSGMQRTSRNRFRP